MNLFRHYGTQKSASTKSARWLRAALCLAMVGVALGSATTASAYQVSFSQPDSGTSISVSSSEVTRWQLGQYEILHLRGLAKIQQFPITATADEAILWVETPNEAAGQEHKIIVYLEGNVVVQLKQSDPTQAASDRIVDSSWLGRFFTRATVDLDQATRSLGGQAPPAIFARARTALAQGSASTTQKVGFESPQQSVVINPQTGAVEQVGPAFQAPQFGQPQMSQPQLSQPQPGQVTSGVPLNPSQSQFNQGSLNQGSSSSPSKFDFSSRDPSVRLNIKSISNPANPNERITSMVGGIRIVIDSPELSNAQQFRGDQDRKLYIVADNLIQWHTEIPGSPPRDQFYLEGNVVFAKGSRTIYSERMYYDVDTQQGTILKAEIMTTVPNYRGAVRLKAEVVQQYDANNLQAFGSAFTSSRLGVPRYWLQSESIGIARSQVPSLVPSDGGGFDPQTGLPQVGTLPGSQDEFTVDAQRNRVYLAGLPVFAWPRLRTSLNDPTLYLDRLGINNDQIFGFQLTTGWNMYQILGLDKPPEGTRWVGVLDYLSERGLGVGSEFDYELDSLFGIQGKVKGEYKSWFINDDGLDFLGLDRFNLVPEEDYRGRISLSHRQELAPGYTFRAEVGYLSDRNFLEQFYEREWDTQKDQTTGFWLEQNSGTRSNNLTFDLQVNDFFAQTSDLRFDQFVLGQPILNNHAVWHSHSQAGYVRMRQADAPLNASELAKFDPLAWEADVDGFKFGTRQEIDFPTQVGPIKFVPYLLGDASYWQEALDGNDLTRVYGQAGIRASLPMWKVDPSVQSVLWNVNGLAHKVTFDLDAFYADASQDLDELALYDELDDDSQEHFRRRFAFDTFGIGPGGDVPLAYDERYFALRSGMQSNITAPSSEIADDLAAIKFGIRQRWQTKRGMPGRERIIDWITLDMQTILFPEAARDNNGADFGMFDYDFRWHVGDRFSLVSDGYFDFFSQGLRTASFGANIGRPEVGNAYVGYRMIEGPISSNILSAAITYRMSDKWGVKAGGQVDFGETGTIGQSVNFVYIGESFLWQFGVNYDVSRDNLGLRFGFEPRFINKPRLFRPGGVAIQPAGSRWLE